MHKCCVFWVLPSGRPNSFATQWTVAHQAPLSMGFSRPEYWSALPFPSPGDLPDPGLKPTSPALEVDSLPPESPGKPSSFHYTCCFFPWTFITFVFPVLDWPHFMPLNQGNDILFYSVKNGKQLSKCPHGVFQSLQLSFVLCCFYSPTKHTPSFFISSFFIVEQVRIYPDKVSASRREESIRICVRMNESAFPLPSVQRASSCTGVLTSHHTFLGVPNKCTGCCCCYWAQPPSPFPVVDPVNSFSNSVSNETFPSRQPGPLTKTVYIFVNTHALCVCWVCEELQWTSQICSALSISAAVSDWAFPCTDPYYVLPVSSSWFKIGFI